MEGEAGNNTSNETARPGKVEYNAVEWGDKLAGLDALVSQVEQPLHQDRFQKVQGLLKKNNELIVQVMEQQREASEVPIQPTAKEAGSEEGGGEETGEVKEEGNTGAAQQAALQKCALMIKELNDNLTQVYDVYAALQPTKDEK